MKTARKNNNPGIRPPSSLRTTPVDPVARKIIQENGKVIVGNLGNPGRYSEWGVMETYHECWRHVVETVPPNELHGYGPSQGTRNLLVEIAQMNIGGHIGLPDINPEEIMLYPGISGAADPLMRMIRSVCGDGPVVIPSPSYILYHWEAERIGNRIIPVRLKNGLIDLDDLERVMRNAEDIKMLIIYSVNNPLSVATTKENFKRAFELVNETEKRTGGPIAVFIDDVYRIFQSEESQGDLLNALKETGRLGITIILDSISKMIGAAGDRVGYIRVIKGKEFPNRTQRIIDKLVNDMQPSLGKVSMPAQYAFAEFLRKYRKDAEFKQRVDQEMEIRRKRVLDCNYQFASALYGQEGIHLHPQYGFTDEVNRSVIVAPYIVFGFDAELMKPDTCQAATMAEIAHQLEHPALLATPMDVFEMREGKEWPGMRTVSMWDTQTRETVVESILAVRNYLKR